MNIKLIPGFQIYIPNRAAYIRHYADGHLFKVADAFPVIRMHWKVFGILVVKIIDIIPVPVKVHRHLQIFVHPRNFRNYFAGILIKFTPECTVKYFSRNTVLFRIQRFAQRSARHPGLILRPFAVQGTRLAGSTGKRTEHDLIWQVVIESIRTRLF